MTSTAYSTSVTTYLSLVNSQHSITELILSTQGSHGNQKVWGVLRVVKVQAGFLGIHSDDIQHIIAASVNESAAIGGIMSAGQGHHCLIHYVTCHHGDVVRFVSEVALALKHKETDTSNCTLCKHWLYILLVKAEAV